MNLLELYDYIDQVVGNFSKKEIIKMLKGLEELPLFPDRLTEMENKLSIIEGNIMEMVEQSESNRSKIIVHCPNCNNIMEVKK